MTPEEYLADLQREFSGRGHLLDYANALGHGRWRVQDTPSIRALLVAKGLDVASTTGEEVIDLIRQDRAETAALRHREILSVLPPHLVTRVTTCGPIAVGHLECAQFSASAIPCPDGGFVLAFRSGLEQMVDALSTTLLSMAAPKLGGPPGIGVKAGRDMIINIVRWQHRLGLPHSPDVPMPEDVAGTVEMLTSTAFVFVHAHELAHVLLGHVEKSERRMIPDFDALELTASHQDEFAADALALDLTVRLLAKQTGHQKQALYVAWGAVWTFLQLALLIESFEPREAGTHPSARARLGRLEPLAKTTAVRLGFKENAIYTLSGPLSRAFGAALAGQELSFVRTEPSALRHVLVAASRDPDGMANVKAAIFTWLATTTIPRRLCDEIGRIRADTVREARRLGLNGLEKMGPSEVSDVSNERPDLREVMFCWMALDLRMHDDRVRAEPFERMLFGNYIPRIERSTARYLTTDGE